MQNYYRTITTQFYSLFRVLEQVMLQFEEITPFLALWGCIFSFGDRYVSCLNQTLPEKGEVCELITEMDRCHSDRVVR